MGIQESGWDPLILVALVSCLHHNLLLTTQNRKVSNFRFKGGVFIFAVLFLVVKIAHRELGGEVACGVPEGGCLTFLVALFFFTSWLLI